MTWFRAADYSLHRCRSLDSDDNTSCNSEVNSALRLTTSLVEETDYHLFNYSTSSSSLIGPESETARLPNLLPVALYIDDMAAPTKCQHLATQLLMMRFWEHNESIGSVAS